MHVCGVCAVCVRVCVVCAGVCARILCSFCPTFLVPPEGADREVW